jgi:hypothetical protein
MSDIIQGQSDTGMFVGASADGDTLAISTSGFRPTYRYTAVDVTPVATATDVLVLSGSSSKVIRISRISVMGGATATSIYDLYLYKRSAANTGGTLTNPVPTNADSTDAAATGVLSLYTANPSALGAGIVLDASKIFLGTAALTSPTTVFTWGVRGDKQPIIRAGESLSFNFAGAAVPTGSSLYLTIEWTEDVI